MTERAAEYVTTFAFDRPFDQFGFTRLLDVTL